MTNKAILRLSERDIGHTALVCRALSVEVRLEILQMLSKSPVGITELAACLEIPLSTMSGHLRVLEEAGLISVTPLPGSRGGKKICNSLVERVEIEIISQMPDVLFSECLLSYDMPVGNYFDFEVSAPCGLASAEGFLATDDNPAGFALPSHVEAQILWFTTGFLEYRFDLKNSGLEPQSVSHIEISFEICSEAYGYNEKWRSDISVSANALPLGTVICRGDHGGRPGKLNPTWWPDYATQFGDLHKIVISETGTAIDGVWSESPNLRDVLSKNDACIRLKIGVDKNSQYVGGINLFGKRFGNHAQGILLQAFVADSKNY